jgi:antimicrobial peptide system SdpA family protein
MKINKYSVFSFVFAILIVVCFPFFFISLYFGGNPLYSAKKKTILSLVFPEGWAFFTRSSQEPRLYVYKYNNEQHFEMVNFRNFSKEYIFGIYRHNRIILMEFNNVLQKLNNDSVLYRQIKTDKIENLNEYIDTARIEYNNVLIDKKLVPDIEGKYILALQFMLPWQLIHKNNSYPSKVFLYSVNVLKK